MVEACLRRPDDGSRARASRPSSSRDSRDTTSREKSVGLLREWDVKEAFHDGAPRTRAGHARSIDRSEHRPKSGSAARSGERERERERAAADTRERRGSLKIRWGIPLNRCWRRSTWAARCGSGTCADGRAPSGTRRTSARRFIGRARFKGLDSRNSGTFPVGSGLARV